MLQKIEGKTLWVDFIQDRRSVHYSKVGMSMSTPLSLWQMRTRKQTKACQKPNLVDKKTKACWISFHARLSPIKNSSNFDKDKIELEWAN
jgi:hypothetical protein